MRTKKNKVYLTWEQRKELVKVVKGGTHSAEKMRRAQILLLLDENKAPVKKQSEIAEICQSNVSTVSQLAMKFTTMGLAVIERKKRMEPPIAPIVTGEIEAHIIAISCSEAPAGHNKWTLSLIAKRLIELNIIPTISRDTVGRALKKRIKTSSE